MRGSYVASPGLRLLIVLHCENIISFSVQKGLTPFLSIIMLLFNNYNRAATFEYYGSDPTNFIRSSNK